MKFTCTQENLLRGVSQVTPIAGRNSQLPILQNILLVAQNNSLSLTTTDLEIGVKTIVGGKVEEEGGCALPAKRFLEYVQQLPKNNPVVIERKDNKIFVSTKGFRAQFLSADPEEYPLLPENVRGETIIVPSDGFCGAIGQTIFSATREETRPEIRSVYITWREGKLYVAATDSFRLAEYVLQLASGVEFSFILPLASAQEVVRLFSGAGDIQVVLHDNYVLFSGGGVEFTSRLVDGQYPKYEDIIPTTHTTHITVQRSEFLRALKTLSVFLPKESRRVSLAIRPEQGQLIARVAGGETGEGEVILDIEGDGEDIDVLINIQYLLDGITHLSGDVCQGFLSGVSDPVVFRRHGESDVYTYVVMPIQA